LNLCASFSIAVVLDTAAIIGRINAFFFFFFCVVRGAL